MPVGYHTHVLRSTMSRRSDIRPKATGIKKKEDGDQQTAVADDETYGQPSPSNLGLPWSASPLLSQDDRFMYIIT